MLTAASITPDVPRVLGESSAAVERHDDLGLEADFLLSVFGEVFVD
jgi:hypothetical protein